MIFLTTSMFIFGLSAVFKPGMILFFIVEKHYTNVTERFIGPVWHKPLYQCATCMASSWGTLSYWFYIYPMFTPHWEVVLLNWVIWIFSLAGLNYVVSMLINK